MPRGFGSLPDRSVVVCRSGIGHTHERRFPRHVRPILADNCFQCHGPDSRTRPAPSRHSGRYLRRASQRHPDRPGATRRIASSTSVSRTKATRGGGRARPSISPSAGERSSSTFTPPRPRRVPARALGDWKSKNGWFYRGPIHKLPGYLHGTDEPARRPSRCEGCGRCRGSPAANGRWSADHRCF